MPEPEKIGETIKIQVNTAFRKSGLLFALCRASSKNVGITVFVILEVTKNVINYGKRKVAAAAG